MNKGFRSRRPSSSRRWPLALQSSRAPARSLEQRRLLSIEPLEVRRLLTVHDLTTATDYATIQAAVNAANPGDTLLADAGTYAENVTVNKSLTIEGAQHGVDARTRSGAESIVDGTTNGGKTPFYVTADNVTIDGFTVEGATSATQFGFGILEGGGTSGTQILNNIVQDNIAGLSLANAPAGNPGLIQHNLFQNNNQTGPVGGTAIYTDQSNAGGNLANVTIDANAFSNDQNAGVIIGSTDATVSTATNLAISNNTFNGEGNAVLLFNTTSSAVTSNTMTNSLGSQFVIGGGDNGLKVTNNLIQNGATRGIRIGDFGGGSTNQNVTINYNNIQGNATAGLEIDSAAGAYTGTLDASKNWWGDISGPTIASNVGGLGQTIVDPSNQITYRPWLIYGTDADLVAPGFQLPTTVPVTTHGDTSAAVNDFTLLQNAIGAAAAGQTIDLSGTFNWTGTNAAAAYAASTSTAPTADIRGVALPDGVNNLTITTSTTATVTGVGDSTDGIYNSFLFSAANPPGALGNTQLTVSNLKLDHFKSGIMLGWNNGGTFDGTLIKNNTITVAADNDNNVNDVQGIAVYFWKGQNQTMTGNTIDFEANGTRTAGTGARSYGFQDGTTGGTGYNGLSIDHNIFQLLPSAVGGSEVVTGVWENGHNDDNASHISISNNQFLGLAGRRLDIGLQLSSQTSHMSIDSNTFTDVKYVYWVGTHNGDLPGDQFTFTNNVLTHVGDANGIFLQNAIDNTPGDVITINWGTNNTIDAKTGIRGLNELSTQATGASRPTGGATDLNAVVAFGPIPADWVNATWGPQGRFTNPLATPDGTPGPIAFGFNTFTTIQAGVNAVDVGGTVNVLPDTYAENVTISKNLTLTGTTTSPAAIIQPIGGDGITIGAPATDVTLAKLEVTGAAHGINASGLTTLTLSDLTLVGNTISGGTISNIPTVNDTPITGNTGASDTITGGLFQRGSNDAVTYSGVTNLNITGSDGSDTFNVTPAVLTKISINGGLPNPPATPGDTLNVVLAGTTTPALSDTVTATGHQGSWTFGNRMPIDYSRIETLSNNTDLSISKTDNGSPAGTAVSGGSLTYTIVVTNGGANGVTGATVNDTFPADFSGTYTASATGGATGFTASGSGSIHDSVNLPAGSTVTYTVSGTISAAATGTLSNTATVTSPADTLDTNLANNSSTDTDTLTKQADLKITKTDNSPYPGHAVRGASLIYTIVVTNAGPSNVTGATVADTFPADFTGATYTAVATGGATGFTASGSGNISDTDNLPAGSTITYTVTGTVALAATGTLSNTATVTAPAGVTDTNTGNNSATDSDTVSSLADLSITKSDDHGGNSATATSGNVVPGTALVYTIIVSNAGPNPATGATVSDNFPTGFTGATFTATATGGATGFTASGSGNISDTVDLPVGSSITYVVSGTVSSSATGTLSNNAKVTAPADIADTNLTNNSAIDNDILTPKADLSITKTDGKTNVIAGTSDTYTIVVANAGPSAVTGASVSDTFPADFTGAAFTATATGGATGFTASGSGNISDTVNLPVGSTLTYLVTGTVSATATGNLSNTATVAVPAGVTDTNTANNSATDTDSITAQAAPAITSANAADFAEGSFSTFTVTATGVPTPSLVESGPLPGGVTFVDNGNGTATLSGTPATGTHGTFTLTITAHNGVSPDAVQTFTLTVSPATVLTSPFGYLAGVPGDGTAQTFVHNLYRELLGREPDPSGSAHWVNFLQQNDNAAGRSQVISSFMNSEEYKAHYITTLYEVLLGRGPDTGGLQFWTGQMGNPGTPGGHSGSADEKFILSEFVGSSEFYADAGGTPQGFAQALYLDLLGRTGETSGVNAWAGLTQAQPNNRDGVVRSFLSTPEAEHLLLDSFYPAPGGTASHPLPAPGTTVPSGSFDLAVITGDGWENLYLEGPFDNAPQGNDAFFAELAGGVAWDDVQLQLLATDQFYTNPNRPVTS